MVDSRGDGYKTMQSNRIHVSVVNFIQRLRFHACVVKFLKSCAIYTVFMQALKISGS